MPATAVVAMCYMTPASALLNAQHCRARSVLQSHAATP
jgi:hypothetical protein